MIQELYEKARKRKDSGKPWKLVYKLNKLIAVTLFPIVCQYQKKSGIDANGKVIISLTSFTKRMKEVPIAIASLMNQSMKPKRIILWLASEQFPNGEKDLTNRLLKLKKRGLEIRFCEDLLSHKKYYFTMKENPDDYIITVDDDMLYPENLVEQLWESHLQHPDCVCCEYAHKIVVQKDGMFAPYREWQSCYGESTIPDYQILPVGCGGVLYPPHILSRDVLDKEAIKELCPQMDDLWLKTMSVMNGKKSVICRTGSLIYFDIIGTRKSGLQHTNVGQSRNDEAIKKIVARYPELVSKIIGK